MYIDFFGVEKFVEKTIYYIINNNLFIHDFSG